MAGKLGKLRLAPDERRERARPAAPSGSTGAHQAIERDRPRHTLQLMGTPVLDDEQPRDLPLHGSGTARLRARQPLPRGATFGASPNTSPVASTTTGPKSRPRRAANSWQIPTGVLDVERFERRENGDRRAGGPLGVVLLGARIAEQSHQTVAELLQHMAGHTASRLPRRRRDRGRPGSRQSSASSCEASRLNRTGRPNSTRDGAALGGDVRGLLRRPRRRRREPAR